MEDSYDRLVQYYLEKLQERYKRCTDNPEIMQALELLRIAGADKIKRILNLLDKQNL